MKAGFRYGDAAPMAVIEFVDRDVSAKGAADNHIFSSGFPIQTFGNETTESEYQMFESNPLERCRLELNRSFAFGSHAKTDPVLQP